MVGINQSFSQSIEAGGCAAWGGEKGLDTVGLEDQRRSLMRTESWQVEVEGGCRNRGGGSRWHLRRVQDFAPAAREEGDCDLYNEEGKSQRMPL